MYGKRLASPQGTEYRRMSDIARRNIQGTQLFFEFDRIVDHRLGQPEDQAQSQEAGIDVHLLKPAEKVTLCPILDQHAEAA